MNDRKFFARSKDKVKIYIFCTSWQLGGDPIARTIHFQKAISREKLVQSITLYSEAHFYIIFFETVPIFNNYAARHFIGVFGPFPFIRWPDFGASLNTNCFVATSHFSLRPHQVLSHCSIFVLIASNTYSS